MCTARRARHAIDAERERALQELDAQLAASQFRTSLEAIRQRVRPTWAIDMQGTRRGLCPRCDACPGFHALPMGPDAVKRTCLHCGCPSDAHDDLGPTNFSVRPTGQGSAGS